MSKIMLFEEYTRTVGFRYSEPTIEVSIQIPSVYNSFENNLVNGSIEDTIKSILDANKVKIKEFRTISDAEAEMEEAQEEKSLIRENLSSVTIFVYNEKEIDSIIENLIDRLVNKYDVYVDSESMRVKEA